MSYSKLVFPLLLILLMSGCESDSTKKQKALQDIMDSCDGGTVTVSATLSQWNDSATVSCTWDKKGVASE